MKPTAEQLNKAMAEACGWTEICKLHDGSLYGIPPNQDKYDGEEFVPVYCKDRNTLPEILSNFVSAERYRDFCLALPLSYYDDAPCSRLVWEALNLPMRSIVIAALKTLEQWQEDGEIER